MEPTLQEVLQSLDNFGKICSQVNPATPVTFDILTRVLSLMYEMGAAIERGQSK